MANWLWHQFRRLSLVLQWSVGTASLGAIEMAVFVGNIGIAAMGSVIGLSGALFGAAAAIGSWASAIVVGAKRRQQ